MADRPLVRLRDYTVIPGGRLREHGDWSAEQWRDERLAPAFIEAWVGGDKLTVDLDGCVGFAASFIEEAFGGLARTTGISGDEVLSGLDVICEDEPGVIEDIERYLRETTEER